MSERADDVRDLLGAWALDALDDVERVAVERAIAADPDLAAEARALRETVAWIAEHDAEQPPAHLRDAVLAQVQDTEQESVRGAATEEPRAGEISEDATAAIDRRAGTDRSGRHAADETPLDTSGGTPLDAGDERTRAGADGDGDELAARRRQRSRWRALAAAAAFIAAIAVPTVIAVNQADRAERAEQQATEIAEALTTPGAELVGQELDDGARVVAVLAEGSALFAANGMAQLDDQDYQLWVVHDEEAISAGVLAWHDGQLSAQVEDFPADAALAITAEPPGGSDQPTSDPLVVLSAS